MKLRIVILPLLVFALFGYGVAKLDEVTDSGTKQGTFQALKAAVDKDIQNVKNAFKKDTQ